MATKINPATMRGYGKNLTVFDQTFPVGPRQAPTKKATGNVTLSQPGQVLENVDMRGFTVQVTAPDCVIRGCLFNYTSWHTIQSSGQNLLIELNTFDGEKANKSGVDYFWSDTASCTIRNNMFFDTPSDAINVCAGIVEKNYFAQAGYQGGAHADAISVPGVRGPVAIRYNYIDWVDTPDNAVIPNCCVKLTPHFGEVRNVTVERNILLGGGYQIYAQATASDPNTGRSYTNKGTVIKNNLIGMGYWAQPGKSDAFWIYPGYDPSTVLQNNAAFETASDTTNPPDNPPPSAKPVNSQKPVIEGELQIGGKLATASGVWLDVNPNWQWAWQWKLDGKPITNALSWGITASNPGKYTVEVSATNAAGKTTVESDPVQIGESVPPPDPEPEDTTFSAAEMEEMRKALDVLNSHLA